MKKIKNLSQLGIISTQSILVIMPHPDDEAIFAAGMMQKAAKSDLNIKLITLTKGEESSLKFGYPEDVDLSHVRPKELKRALGILGVDTFDIWEIPDGKIEIHAEDISKRLTDEILSFKPHYVLTLEPAGIYGHPDHIAASKVVSDLYRAQNNVFKLMYATVTDKFNPSKGARNMAKKGSIITPIEANVAIDLSIREAYRKLKAIYAHRSQFQKGLLLPALVKWMKRGIIRKEYFHLIDNTI